MEGSKRPCRSLTPPAAVYDIIQRLLAPPGLQQLILQFIDLAVQLIDVERTILILAPLRVGSGGTGDGGDQMASAGAGGPRGVS